MAKKYTLQFLLTVATKMKLQKKNEAGPNQINIPHKINSGAYQTAPPEN